MRVGRARSYEDVERAALWCRRTLFGDLSMTRALPCLSLFEALDSITIKNGQTVIPVSYEVADPGFGALGATRYDGRTSEIVICLSDETYDGLESGEPRSRFTLAHEVGHALLHTAELVRLTQLPHAEAALLRSTRSPHPSYLDSEWQANAFASAILVPARGLEMLADTGPFEAVDIADQFDVSMQCAQIRLETFHRRRAQLLAAG